MRVAGHLCPGLLGVFLLLVLPLPAGAVMYNGAPAIDALGQYDEDPLTNPGPIYTKSQPHDAPNRLGFAFPRMIVIDDANHRLFVADTINNRVLLYDLNANNTLKDRIPDSVLGQENFYRNETATTQAGMDTPHQSRVRRHEPAALCGGHEQMTVRVCVDPENQNPNETSEDNCRTRDTLRPPFRPGRFREAAP